MKTIFAFADASYCARTGNAGIGLFSVSGKAIKQASRVITGGADSSGEAEGLALTRAVTLALESFAKAGDIIVAVSDCEEAIKRLDGRVGRDVRNDRLSRERADLERVASLLGVKVRFERFGETALPRAGKEIHTWCDRAARQALAMTGALTALTDTTDTARVA